jgi:hypothetical protein
MRKFLMLLLLSFFITGSLQARPLLSFKTEKVDFGKVPQKSWFYHEVVLQANDEGDVTIDSVETFCDCILLPVMGKTIPAGDSLVVTLSFFSGIQVSNKEWRPHVFFNNKRDKIYIRIMADIIPEIERHRPIYVKPYSVAASQFGDQEKKEFSIQIINPTDINIPLKLIYFNDEYYNLEFPVFVPPNDTAFGEIILNEKGLVTEFENTIIFEYIDKTSDKKNYSIPVRRKIFVPRE